MTWLAIGVRLKLLFVKRCAIQVAWMSTDVWFKWFWLPVLVVTGHGQEKHVIYRVICRKLCVIDLDVKCDVRFKRVESQMIWLSSDLRFKRFLVVNWFEIQLIWLSIDLRFKWVGCQSMCASNDFGCLLIWASSDVVVNWSEIQVIRSQLIWDSSDSVVNWSEIQVIWLSTDLRFKWVGCQLIWDSSDLDVKWWGSSDLVVNWCVIQMVLSNEAFLRDLLQNWSFEAQKRSFSARLPSKMKLWRSKTKHFCETSFKNEALKIKSQAFLRDFLKKSSFEAQKQKISARLPSKLKLWSSKTKLFCETSCKNEALQLQNQAFLRDFLQKWSFEAQKTKLFCETSFKNDMSTGHLTSELQYVLAIFNCMLQKYCACHEKVAPRHTNSCNCHAKWSLQSNTSVTWNLQPFHGFSVGCFKHRHHKARNHCACHAKRIVPDPLEILHACQRFCNPHELLRLPRILQRVEIPAPATQNTLWSSKNVPRPSVFNDFDFQIALARRRGAIFAKLNFQEPAETLKF